MHRRALGLSLGSALATFVIVGLALLAPSGAGAADVTYTFQPLAPIGGMAGDVPIPKGLIWLLGPLNDNGQLLVDAGTVSGGLPEILLQYAAGKFTPLVAVGLDGPLGPWPKDVAIYCPPLSMNGRGDSVFNVTHGTDALIGTFYRDAQSGKMTPVMVKGVPATGDLTFTAAITFSPAINNRDEIALVGGVTGTGRPSGIGLFFRAPDGALQPILVPGQALPDGKKGQPGDPSITDAGVVAFLVGASAYQWEKGSLTPLVTVGMAAPGGGTISMVTRVLLNNQNSSALISAGVNGTPGHGLYRAAGDTLTAVAVPGQEMPGGGKLKSIANGPAGDISAATEAGQHAFVATLDDNTTAVYRVGADGSLSLVLKTGTTTPLGKITRFGQILSPAMNSKGQVVLSISFDNGRDTLVLLTPTTP